MPNRDHAQDRTLLASTSVAAGTRHDAAQCPLCLRVTVAPLKEQTA